MALVFNDRVKETSVTTGTGTLTLDGAVQGFETFSSAIGNSNTTYYAIELPGTTEFEVGRGTVSAGQLARTQVISSSNSDSPVDFSAGTKIVFCTLPASKAVIKDASGNIPIDANKTIEFGDSGETISGDGTHLTIAGSDHINVNAQGELTLSSESNEIFFRDGSTLFLKVQRDGDFNVNFTSNQDKKIEFIGNDGGSTVDMLVLDGAEAGKATFNDKVILGANKVIEFGDAGETISGNGTDLTIASSGFININASSDVKLNAAGNDIRLYSSATEFLRLTHSSGDAIINSLVSDKDIKFQGNDGGSGITALTLDMSEAGAATFNSTVTANAGLKADNITIDGTEIDLSSGDLTIDVAGDITLDADGGDIIFADASTEIGRFTNDSTDFAIHSSVQDKDIVFKGNDGGSTITAMRLDMSNKGRVSIGSNSFPAERLSVFGEDNTAAATFKVKDTDSRGILIESPYSGFGVGFVGTDGTNSALGFKVNSTEVGRFGTNGFFGIGTTNPQEELHINGADPSIRIQDSDGGITTITQAGNDLTIDSPNDIILDGDQSIKYMDGGSLYMSLSNSSGIRFTSQISDNDMLFRGNDGGSFITALTLDMSEAGDATFNSNIFLGDSKKANFGAGNDLQIYHDSSDSFIDDAGTGDLKIRSSFTRIIDISNDNVAATFASSGVNLRASNSVKFTTTSAGATVTGVLTADGVTLGANESLVLGDAGETISGDGTNLTIASSNNVIFDAAQDILLDSGNGAFYFNDDGSTIGSLLNSSSNFVLKSMVSDKDLIFKGNDGGSEVTALTLDMSEAGAAAFNSTITADGGKDVILGKNQGTNFTNSLLVGHNTTGTLNAAENNTGVGIGALDALTTGDSNVAFGTSAGSAVTTGALNVFIGTSAGAGATDMQGCIAIGAAALGNADPGNNNIAIGESAGKLITGVRNLCIGENAGDNITSGSGNVIIGSAVDPASATGNRQLVIAGNDGSTTTTFITGDSSGNITIPGTVTANGEVLTAGVSAGFAVAMAIAL